MSKFTLVLILLTIFSIIFHFVTKPYFLDRHLRTTHVAEVSAHPDYTLVFVGDSMTEYLGNFDELRSYLKDDFPGKNFLLLNYGYGSSNILSVQERLNKETVHGRKFQPIMDIPFNLIFIESFGNNPLSQYPLAEGLKKQTEALDQIVTTITQKQPKSRIVFIATIAPTGAIGQGNIILTKEKRQQWAAERSAYIQNHINYAKSHQIPIIDIYHQSLDTSGNPNIIYLNDQDFIHPSPTGLYFISDQIAQFIKQHRQMLGNRN